MMERDFYIGYLPKMPKSFARFTKMIIIVFFAAAFGLIAVVWSRQKPFGNGLFEFDKEQVFEGTLQADPIPFLLIKNADVVNQLPVFLRFPIVGEGKHSVDVDVRALNGRRVTLRGKLILRDELKMIEVVSNSVAISRTGNSNVSETTEDLGNFTLKGEIVDSKCYLGVMNPGQSKPHRDCAVACLRGGIPPLFIVKDPGGKITELWLLSEKNEPINTEILDYVAEPIEVSGKIVKRGDQLFYSVDPKSIVRLD